eukprot:UN02021
MIILCIYNVMLIKKLVEIDLIFFIFNNVVFLCISLSICIICSTCSICITWCILLNILIHRICPWQECIIPCIT